MATCKLGIRYTAMICFARHVRYMSLGIYHLHINEQKEQTFGTESCKW